MSERQSRRKTIPFPLTEWGARSGAREPRARPGSEVPEAGTPGLFHPRTRARFPLTSASLPHAPL